MGILFKCPYTISNPTSQSDDPESIIMVRDDHTGTFLMDLYNIKSKERPFLSTCYYEWTILIYTNCY